MQPAAAVVTIPMSMPKDCTTFLLYARVKTNALKQKNTYPTGSKAVFHCSIAKQKNSFLPSQQKAGTEPAF